MQNRHSITPAKPQTLVDRAKAYGELILDELNDSRDLWRKRTLLQVMGASGLGVSASLAGMGAMLWAVTPLVQIHTLWILVVVPLAFLAAGIACLVAAQQQKKPVVLEHTRQRLMDDVAIFQETNLAAAATKHFVRPMATAHPYRLVAGAALVGALVVCTHPWRWLSSSALLAGLLPTVLSALSAQSKRLP